MTITGRVARPSNANMSEDGSGIAVGESHSSSLFCPTFPICAPAKYLLLFSRGSLFSKLNDDACSAWIPVISNCTVSPDRKAFRLFFHLRRMSKFSASLFLKPSCSAKILEAVGPCSCWMLRLSALRVGSRLKTIRRANSVEDWRRLLIVRMTCPCPASSKVAIIQGGVPFGGSSS